MSITINNTTINKRLTIIFDANTNKDSVNDGPVFGSGNTESDVYIDSKIILILDHTLKFLLLCMHFNVGTKVVHGLMN